MKFVVVESWTNKKDCSDPCIFGVFKNQNEAIDFINRRVCLLSGEWEPTDGIITDVLNWKVRRIADYK